MAVNVKIEESWKKALVDEFSKPYFVQLTNFVKQEYKEGKTVYPPGKFIFNAFNLTPFDKVKVVIIGQDPYHGHGQAHGLCFSVQKGIVPPPSLKNVFKELVDDIPGFQKPNHGDLTKWGEQGILLINAILTVRAKSPASHRGKGWEQFTDAVIQKLNDEREGLVFILWGNFAKKKGAKIDTNKHYVLAGTHPSPMAARYGFFGCKHFSKTNEYLTKNGKEPIDWQI